MLDPRALTHAQLAEIVADVQAILWQESRMLPDDPRQYGQYWNPAKEWAAETVEEIADVLDDFRPPDVMPVDLAAKLARPGVAEFLGRVVGEVKATIRFPCRIWSCEGHYRNLVSAGYRVSGGLNALAVGCSGITAHWEGAEMFQPTGKYYRVSRFRRLVIDLMHYSATVPSVTIERRMDLGALSAARQECRPSPTWSAIFIKAYAVVAARTTV